MDSVLNLILRLKKQGNAPKEAQQEFQGLQGTIKGLGGAAQMLAGSAALGAVVAGLKYCVDEAREAAKVMAVTEATIAATGGAAGISAGQVSDIAAKLERMTTASAETIQSGQNLLLTFKEIKGDNFERASAAMLDMAVAMNQGNIEGVDLKGTAVQLGKALNVAAGDTATASKAMSALARSGVSFTSAQKEAALAAIKMGDVAAYQAIVLGELESEFGGVAKSAGDALGPMAKLSVIGGNVAEAFGARLIPWLDGAAQGFLNLVKTGGALYLQFALMTGIITQQEAAAKAAALANDDLAGYLFGVDDASSEVTASAGDAAAAQMALAEAADTEAMAMDGAAASTNTLAVNHDAAVKALERLQAAQATWASGVGQDVINALNEAGVEGREYEAALIAIDEQLGTSFAQDAEKKKKLDELTQAYKDGKISIDEYKAGLNLLYAKDMPETQAAFAGARDRAGELSDKLDRLANRRVQIFIEEVYTAQQQTIRGNAGSTPGGGRAAGGPVEAGTAYVVGEDGPEIFVPQQSGAIVPNHQVSNYMGGVTINVYNPDPAAAAREVSRVLAQQARGLTQSGIAYMG